jgi:AraC-like DNA-binding protein
MNTTQTGSLSNRSIQASAAVIAGPERQGFMARNMQLDVVHHGVIAQRFTVVTKSFGSIRVARVHGTRSSFSRTRRHLADGRDLVSFIISNGGRFQVEGMQGPNRFGANGAAVLESRRESALHKLDDSSGVWSICLDRAPLEPLLGTIHQPLQRCIQDDCAAIRLLNGYLHALFSLDRECDPALATQHIGDLALNALGVTGDAQAMVRERGVRAARLQTVLARLAQDAAEPGLDPMRFAERMQMSVRYLHRLLEPTGRSFSEHLLGCRLERAAAMLRDPDCRLRIAEIAGRAGFSDISHFNRSFRLAYGDTPYGVRVRAVRSAP